MSEQTGAFTSVTHIEAVRKAPLSPLGMLRAVDDER